MYPLSLIILGFICISGLLTSSDAETKNFCLGFLIQVEEEEAVDVDRSVEAIKSNGGNELYRFKRNAMDVKITRQLSS
ncbi:hypothetical protein [Drosophila suzukii associated hytrosavirus 1]|nr:hypothetical protein [Drosophila suzukii associated hytrosavirus 1]